VACADGAIAFGELQLPGRRRLPAAAVLTGHRIPPGTVLA
jgi:methionyl-tRNA formyltransferase